MERDNKPSAMAFIQCIIERVGVNVSQHPEQYLPERIHTDSGCNEEAMAVKKQRWFSFRWMDIDEQISNHNGHCLLFGSKLGIAKSTTGIRSG